MEVARGGRGGIPSSLTTAKDVPRHMGGVPTSGYSPGQRCERFHSQIDLLTRVLLPTSVGDGAIRRSWQPRGSRVSITPLCWPRCSVLRDRSQRHRGAHALLRSVWWLQRHRCHRRQAAPQWRHDRVGPYYARCFSTSNSIVKLEIIRDGHEHDTTKVILRQACPVHRHARAGPCCTAVLPFMREPTAIVPCFQLTTDRLPPIWTAGGAGSVGDNHGTVRPPTPPRPRVRPRAQPGRSPRGAGQPARELQ